ncbi:hypothetical protein BOTBODRAFT_39333 [Botryobasidium botryosum FD-172 SS1]|uniref:tRNA-binding domain-containing protein n=1 Tax=Botryobasidium botryosum (strain FD-172 SS1) TaxID=930990 RepID=A0A067LU30_BOTB1|nr:hypothetical protein BOTBODRAFT_39333 [Botryobasidium botryosum FD-172 SS1]
MSSPLERLAPALRDMVLAATGSHNNALGHSDSDKKDVEEWIVKATAVDLRNDTYLKQLDEVLQSKTYLVGSELTAADVALYGSLHPILSKLPPASYYSTPSITRYFDHIQNHPSVRSAASSSSDLFPPLVPFDIENAPKVERKAEAPKKKAKKEKEETPATDAASTSTPAATSKGDPAEKKESAGDASKKDKKKKEPKEKGKEAAVGTPAAGKKAGGGGAAAAADAESSEPVPSMIDLRVGHIVDIKKHPDADGLYVEQIDIGEETGPRTVVSGLVNYIPIEQMRDKYLVAVCNLKPANMRGVKSFAMVLCATSKDGKDAGIELIAPPEGSKPGDRVYFEGEQYENATPIAQLNPKKKIFETIQPGFTTLSTREAAWVDAKSGSVHRIVTKNGPCVAPTFIGASLS